MRVSTKASRFSADDDAAHECRFHLEDVVACPSPRLGHQVKTHGCSDSIAATVWVITLLGTMSWGSGAVGWAAAVCSSRLILLCIFFQFDFCCPIIL